MKYTYFLIAFILVLFLYNSFNLVENMDNNDNDVNNIIYQNQAKILNMKLEIKDLLNISNQAKDLIKQNGDYIKKNIKSDSKSK